MCGGDKSPAKSADKSAHSKARNFASSVSIRVHPWLFQCLVAALFLSRDLRADNGRGCAAVTDESLARLHQAGWVAGKFLRLCHCRR